MLLAQNLQHVLVSSYFEVGSGRLCNEFMSVLDRFVGSMARRFESEIDRLTQKDSASWNTGDLVSWVVKEVAQLQSVTLSRFYLQICAEDGLNPGQHRIDCSRALSHSHHLGRIYEQAVLDWRSEHQVAPRSEKAVRKRAGRDWAPWLVDRLFDLVDELLKRQQSPKRSPQVEKARRDPPEKTDRTPGTDQKPGDFDDEGGG